MRHHSVSDAVVAGLVDRVDRLEIGLGDLTALRRDLADLASQVRDVAQLAPVAAALPAGELTQPDWLTVTDSDLAEMWLSAASGFVRTVLEPLGAGPRATCWMFHPPVVVEVVALAAQYTEAWSSPDPTGASEWLSRWLPGATERIRAALHPCTTQNAHVVGAGLFQVTDVDAASVAMWWAKTHGHSDEAHTFNFPAL